MMRIAAVTMPKWGIEMTEGTIGHWSKRPGDRVEKGEALLDVETEKILNTVDAPAGGTLRRILAEPGETRPVGALIAVLAPQEVSDAEVDRFVHEFRAASVSFEPQAGTPTLQAPAPGAGDAVSASGALAAEDVPTAPAQSGSELHISPIAQRLAESLGVDVRQLRGTGRNGRITKEDVEAFATARGVTAPARAPAPGPAPGAAGANTPLRSRLSATRAAIARRVSESRQSIPDFRLHTEVFADALALDLAARRAVGGVRVSLNDLIVRSVALALRAHPTLNAHFENDTVLTYPRADVAIAVATPGGLMTPVIRGAETLTVEEIARCSAALIERARSATLMAEEIAGATFTVSNLGPFGIQSFDAIINPPQVAILAVGSLEARPIVRADNILIAKMMNLTLTVDHRLIDGATGARFLAEVRAGLEQPQRL